MVVTGATAPEPSRSCRHSRQPSDSYSLRSPLGFRSLLAVVHSGRIGRWSVLPGDSPSDSRQPLGSCTGTVSLAEQSAAVAESQTGLVEVEAAGIVVVGAVAVEAVVEPGWQSGRRCCLDFHRWDSSAKDRRAVGIGKVDRMSGAGAGAVVGVGVAAEAVDMKVGPETVAGREAWEGRPGSWSGRSTCPLGKAGRVLSRGQNSRSGRVGAGRAGRRIDRSPGWPGHRKTGLRTGKNTRKTGKKTGGRPRAGRLP